MLSAGILAKIYARRTAQAKYFLEWPGPVAQASQVAEKVDSGSNLAHSAWCKTITHRRSRVLSQLCAFYFGCIFEKRLFPQPVKPVLLILHRRELFESAQLRKIPCPQGRHDQRSNSSEHDGGH